MTGRDMIAASLRLIAALEGGETPSAQEATDGLAALNRLLGTWSNEDLMIHTVVREEFALTAGDASYTMGSGANFNTARPIRILRATIEVQSSTPTVEYPLTIRTAEEWAAISIKDLTSSIPTDLFPEGTYPNETLNFYPTPSAANRVVLYSHKPLTEIATLDTNVSFPPGYDRALIYNLSVDIAPEYGRPVSDVVGMTAIESKAALKRRNHKPGFLKVDNALLDQGSTYDIFRGDYE